ncbi:hypothetical protein ROZALSC1DRAFT_14632 [Rozella allomycis CSF55]|uniref:Uncharacterized protein n=1 Tax=Rozella allomycis (strain CSF55) TaxID=988480 RepID=A0A4P9YIM1_ROZAC|nr:hypothetical protein ROZALSC1DRAFT_14632 [Rozella allomycis CSF55]
MRVAFLSLLTIIAAQNTTQVDFCTASGQALMDGTQNRGGSCSNTIQGSLPDVTKMVSTIILSPSNGDRIEEGTPFVISVKTVNLQLGFFDNPQTEYYLSPQTLNSNGIIEGHQHVVVQALTDGTVPPSAQDFKFFKGLNGESADGVLSVNVTEGIAGVGSHRICTITGSRGHQPVLMPVAQRGSQDDCIRIEIVKKKNGKGGKGFNNVAEDVTEGELERVRHGRRREGRRRFRDRRHRD